MKIFMLVIALVLILLPWAAGLAFYALGMDLNNVLGLTVAGVIFSYALAGLIFWAGADA